MEASRHASVCGRGQEHGHSPDISLGASRMKLSLLDRLFGKKREIPPVKSYENSEELQQYQRETLIRERRIRDLENEFKLIQREQEHDGHSD